MRLPSLFIIVAVLLTSCWSAGSVEPSVLGYLFPPPSGATEDTTADVAFVKQVLAQLHAQQHPPKGQCKTKRLLVTQFANSFEGLGSILKLVLLGLAEAAHENRTLIWGLDLPFMFENSREEWYDNVTHTGRRDVDIEGRDGFRFDCGSYQHYDGSGPYACFFQALSSCTIDDVSFAELRGMGPGGFDDGARVRIQEERRAPGAAYHYPVYNPAYTTLVDDYPYPVRNLRHKWAAALGAYVFRPKGDVLAWLEGRRRAVWPPHLGGTRREPGCSRCDGPPEGDGGRLWGLHVRHGDLKALKDVYVPNAFPYLAPYLGPSLAPI